MSLIPPPRQLKSSSASELINLIAGDAKYKSKQLNRGSSVQAAFGDPFSSNSDLFSGFGAVSPSGTTFPSPRSTFFFFGASDANFRFSAKCSADKLVETMHNVLDNDYTDIVSFAEHSWSLKGYVGNNRVDAQVSLFSKSPSQDIHTIEVSHSYGCCGKFNQWYDTFYNSVVGTGVVVDEFGQRVNSKKSSTTHTRPEILLASEVGTLSTKDLETSVANFMSGIESPFGDVQHRAALSFTDFCVGCTDVQRQEIARQGNVGSNLVALLASTNADLGRLAATCLCLLWKSADVLFHKAILDSGLIENALYQLLNSSSTMTKRKCGCLFNEICGSSEGRAVLAQKNEAIIPALEACASEPVIHAIQSQLKTFL